MVCSRVNDLYLYSGIAEFIEISVFLAHVTFNKPRLMSHIGAVRENVCAYSIVFPQSERWRCQYKSA